MSSKKQIGKCPHGVMFHHFHDEKHPIEQGSISAEKFSLMLDWLEENYNLLNAGDFQYRLLANQLQSNDISLTFDDALQCQYEVAVPILNNRKIEAFFFVYSSAFLGQPDNLEIYRYFRSTQFKTIDHFYGDFFSEAENFLLKKYQIAKKKYDGIEYLSEFPFYTNNDKWFRYLRDLVLGRDQYDELMQSIMQKYNFNPTEVTGKLWMCDQDLRELVSAGHTVGLHSYSHPLKMSMSSREIQTGEYKKNFEHLSFALGKNPTSMSHPSGSYNSETLKILMSINIEIGFRSSFGIKQIQSNLEVPREDHSNILKMMS